MPDYYHAPALVLTALLLPAFGYLYLRSRDVRTLLWFLGFLFALVAMSLIYTMSPGDFSVGLYPWAQAAGEASFQISSALFLGSLSPVTFRLGRLRVLFVIPYTVPLVIYAIFLYGILHGATPHGNWQLLLLGLGVVSFLTALLWGLVKYNLPPGLGISFSATIGGCAFWVFFNLGPAQALNFVQSANLVMTALLVTFVFRRFSPGVALSVMGFLAWSLGALQMFPSIARDAAIDVPMLQVVVMGKVVAALGMILLALEDELAFNQAARERERRARRELEAYTKLILTRRRVEDFDRQGTEICETVVTHSRFTQAALLLHGAGRYRVAGFAGMGAATAKALDELAGRIPPTGLLASGLAPPAVEQSQTVLLDLAPWLRPGDDLKHLGLTSVFAVPMMNRSEVEGALLLTGMRPMRSGRGDEPLRADDLLPIEMLTARLQATRNQTMLFEKLVDSEKFGHLGQLAASVTQQLNSPLTVILGYASLLDETAALDPQDRKGVESILIEARHMRSTLESLSRIARPNSDELAAVSVSELLSDMEELHRAEFLQHSIEFRLNIAPALPRVLCSAQQLRQAVRQCLQFAMNAVESPAASPGEPKTIRVEAACEDSLVQILVAHSGPGFLNPERAFDPYVAPQDGRSSSVGLSLCATILRDNNGRASAVNFEPRGAAIILELQAA
jgi:signal transduction histidine kinase